MRPACALDGAPPRGSVLVALRTHKVECYFLATVRGGQLRPDWVDFGGEVSVAKAALDADRA